jgi:hypothetical protein
VKSFVLLSVIRYANNLVGRFWGFDSDRILKLVLREIILSQEIQMPQAAADPWAIACSNSSRLAGSSLWYATYNGGTYWTDRGQIKTLTAAAGLNQAGTLNGIVGSNDTPALVVNNNFLYCIHRGGNSWNDGGYLDGLQT